jgi:hypothetical protein
VLPADIPEREPIQSDSSQACRKLELELPSPSQLESANEPKTETQLELAASSFQKEPAHESNGRPQAVHVLHVQRLICTYFLYQ